MLNLLVETKNEYIAHLTNILTPLIFEGIQSIYKEAQKMSDTTDVLKIFQTYLKRIPKWNQNLINKETERIINSSHSYGWLSDLIKATLKSSLIVLMYNPTKKTQEKVDPSFYKNISSSDFIHKVYIECAREIWNNPYLLYHNYPSIEIKRNQRDCIIIIKDCIKEALRKLLPVKHILSIYLGEDIEQDINDDNFEKNISEAEEKNLTKIINKDLLENNSDLYNEELNNKKSNNMKLNKELEYKIFDKNADYEDSKTIGSKILDIIKSDKIVISNIDDNTKQVFTNKNNDLTSIIENENKDRTSDDDFISETNKKLHETSSITGSLDNDTSELDSNVDKQNNDTKLNLDNKIKKILNNDLVETEFDTSLTELNGINKYQEIFSNSDNKIKNQKTDKLFQKFKEF
jgi:hypothetical protein